MADGALFIGFGEVVRGREARAVEVFNESAAYYAGLQEAGTIETWQVVLLGPHGGDLGGFFLLTGDRAKLAALTADDDFDRQTTRADLIVDGLGVVQGLVNEGLARGMEIYQEEIDKLS
jgi:hypothetical protein